MTLKDIAAMTGYSVSTVSRVLSGKAKGRSDKVQREIWEAAVKTNYVKNTGAASLRSKESTVQKGMIGVVFARGFESFDDEFYLQIEQSVHRVTLNHGYQIGETLILDDVLSHPELLSKYTGIVLIGKCAIYTLKRVIAACKNIVCTGLNPYFVEIDQVCCDGQDIAKAAVRHFILGGHKRIGYIGECSGDVRFLGYQQTMVEHDINFDTASIFDVPQTKEGGLQAAARFLQLTTRPTAIFCVNDVTAIGFLRGLRNAKAVRQPAIIGVGDIRASNYTIPTLSTIHLHLDEMGALSARMLIDRIERNHSISAKVILPFSLVIRESSEI